MIGIVYVNAPVPLTLNCPGTIIAGGLAAAGSNNPNRKPMTNENLQKIPVATVRARLLELILQWTFLA
ncbi:MAG: hypothetical protein ABSA49_16090 [Rhizomicrobium sp.]